MEVPGRPPDKCTSTVTDGAETPDWARLWTTARLIDASLQSIQIQESANGRADGALRPAPRGRGNLIGNGGP